MAMLPTLCSVAKRLAFMHFGMRLDLSARSIRRVEKILAALHQEQLKTLSNSGFDGVALEFAAYIVEVIQRNFGPAQWLRDCPTAGPDAFPLHWRGQVLYPYAWCQQRIYGGTEDDVWAVFQATVLGKSPRMWWNPFGRSVHPTPAEPTPRRRRDDHASPTADGNGSEPHADERTGRTGTL